MLLLAAPEPALHSALWAGHAEAGWEPPLLSNTHRRKTSSDHPKWDTDAQEH